MMLTRWASVIGSVALAVTLAACGSSEKTVDQAPARRRRRRRGRSAGRRHHADQVLRAVDRRRRQHQGRAGEARLQGRPAVRRERHPHPGQPDREPDHQGRQAAGHRLDRRHRDHHPAAGGGGQQDPGHRLRPADPQQPERRLLRHVRQLQGRRAAGHLAAGRARAEEGGRHDGAATGPFNIELFAGSPDDNNATFFFNGAMSSSSRTSTRARWSSRAARPTSRPWPSCAGTRPPRSGAWRTCSPSTYSGGAKVNGVLSPYDGLSIGILSALKSNGYGTAGQPYPIVTGQDAEVASVKSIIAGEQYATIYKDTRELAEVTVKMADAVLKGGQPEVNNTKDYDNGVKVVPSYLLEPVIVYKDNYQQVLVDSGYYTADAAAVDRTDPAAAGSTRRRPVPPRPAREDGLHGCRRHPADARHHQDLPRRQGAAGRQPVRAPRRDPRDLRRERRRQVDADEGALRGLPARLLRRRDPLRRRARAVRRHPGQRAARHRDHPPGAGAVPAPVDRGEHLPRQRAGHAAG